MQQSDIDLNRKLEAEQLRLLRATADCDGRIAALGLVERELEQDKFRLTPAKFAELQAKVAQARLRLEAAEKARTALQRVVDDLREREALRLERELAARVLTEKQSEFNNAREILLLRRAELLKLQQELPGEEIRLGVLMRELAEARSRVGVMNART